MTASVTYMRGALVTAVKRGDLHAVEALLEKGVNPNERDTFGYTNPLIVAAEKGRVEIMRLLIEKGAALEEKDSGGMTALMRAVTENHEDCARLLLAEGADVNQKTASGNTALMYASRRGRAAMAILLIENGADTEAKNVDKEGPMEAANNARFVEVIKAIEDAPPFEKRSARRNFYIAALMDKRKAAAVHVLAATRQAQLKMLLAQRPKLRISPS